MAASSKLMICNAERRLPCRIKLGIPAGGFGAQLTEMHAWLDENCGADGWAMIPAGLRGVVNDAIAIYLRRWPLPSSPVGCAGSSIEIGVERFGFARIGSQPELPEPRVPRPIAPHSSNHGNAFRKRSPSSRIARSTGISRRGASRSRMPTPVAVT